ncbi:ribonuclease D [Shinella sp. BE166]|uniref:hypothetical protein n=1 Tax=Shinella sp. BE166 TaxID=3373918 RepID=UPI003EBA331D
MTDVLAQIAVKRQEAEAALGTAIAAIRDVVPDASRAIQVSADKAAAAIRLRSELNELIMEHRMEPGVLAERRVNSSVHDELCANPLEGVPAWVAPLLSNLCR